MRVSSIRSLVTVVFLSFTFVVGALRVEAEPSRPQPSLSGRSQGDRFQRVVNQLLQRFGYKTHGDAPTVPIPASFSGDITKTTTFSPKTQR